MNLVDDNGVGMVTGGWKKNYVHVNANFSITIVSFSYSFILLLSFFFKVHLPLEKNPECEEDLLLVKHNTWVWSRKLMEAKESSTVNFLYDLHDEKTKRMRKKGAPGTKKKGAVQ